jgi:hypothetical protein
MREMKQIRAVSHRHVMSRLLRDRRFRRGYEEELEELWRRRRRIANQLSIKRM